jgi:hypothetical protein
MAFADSALSLANGSYSSVLASWHTAGAYKIKRVSLSGFTLSLKPLLLRGLYFISAVRCTISNILESYIGAMGVAPRPASRMLLVVVAGAKGLNRVRIWLLLCTHSRSLAAADPSLCLHSIRKWLQLCKSCGLHPLRARSNSQNQAPFEDCVMRL